MHNKSTSTGDTQDAIARSAVQDNEIKYDNLSKPGASKHICSSDMQERHLPYPYIHTAIPQAIRRIFHDKADQPHGCCITLLIGTLRPLNKCQILPLPREQALRLLCWVQQYFSDGLHDGNRFPAGHLYHMSTCGPHIHNTPHCLLYEFWLRESSLDQAKSCVGLGASLSQALRQHNVLGPAKMHKMQIEPS